MLVTGSLCAIDGIYVGRCCSHALYWEETIKCRDVHGLGSPPDIQTSRIQTSRNHPNCSKTCPKRHKEKLKSRSMMDYFKLQLTLSPKLVN